MKKLIILISFIFTKLILSQQAGTTINYTSYKNINNFVISNNTLFAVSEGGFFLYNLLDTNFVTLNKANGLSSQNATAIAVDNQSKVWIGYLEGFIDVYNQNTGSITKITDIFYSDKTQKRINYMFVKGDTIFVATDFGLSLINTKTLAFKETITKFGSFGSDIKVKNFIVDNLIYVNTESGIAVSKLGVTNLSSPDSWNNYPLPLNFGSITFNKIALKGNAILIATNKGVLKLENGIYEKYDLDGFNLVDVIPLNNGIYALGSYDLIFNGINGYNVLYHSDSPLLKSVILNNNSFYLSTNNGILKINNNNSKYIYPSGPATNSFQYLEVDASGNLWAATGKDGFGIGLMKFDYNNWYLYNNTLNSAQITFNDFYKVTSASDNTVYGLTWGNGFTAFNGNKITTFNTTNTALTGIPKTPSFLVIGDVKKDSKNNTWILNYWPANKKPLSVITSDSTWYHFDFVPFALSTESTFGNMVIDRNNTKWFTINSVQYGLYYFNENGTLSNTADDKWGTLKDSDGLNSNSITSLLLDNRGELWIGTILGVNIIRDVNNPKTSISSSFPLRQQSIICMAVDPLNRKWVGTKQGIFVVSSDGSTLLATYDSKNSPLPTDDIKSIAFDDKKGIAYVGTDYGLTAFYTTALRPVDSFGTIFIYPNPYVVYPGNDTRLTIDGLIKDSNIKIFTISGKLVKEFSSPGGKIAFWDGRDNDGNLVSSGIYILAAYDNEANNVSIQKFAVINK